MKLNLEIRRFAYAIDGFQGSPLSPYSNLVFGSVSDCDLLFDERNSPRTRFAAGVMLHNILGCHYSPVVLRKRRGSVTWRSIAVDYKTAVFFPACFRIIRAVSQNKSSRTAISVRFLIIL